jgi:hypothetical protein
MPFPERKRHPMSTILKELLGTDLRSIGRSDAVARKIAVAPELFAEVFAAQLAPEPALRMRAADAVEKASREHPELLRPFKRRLLRAVALVDQQEVRWHVAQMLPRLELTAHERDLAVAILFDYLEHHSSILKTFSMQALADLALADPALRERVLPVIEFLTRTGTPAMRARGRKLLLLLNRDGRKTLRARAGNPK